MNIKWIIEELPLQNQPTPPSPLYTIVLQKPSNKAIRPWGAQLKIFQGGAPDGR